MACTALAMRCQFAVNGLAEAANILFNQWETEPVRVGVDGEDDDVHEGLPLGPIQARVGKVDRERRKECQRIAGRHPSRPGFEFPRLSIVRPALDEVNHLPE
jgi:hypothetical protein